MSVVSTVHVQKYKMSLLMKFLCNPNAICARFLWSCCSSIRASFFDALEWLVEYTLCVCVHVCVRVCVCGWVGG